MEKNILTELELAMVRNHIKIPALSVKLGIPKDRIYKWYQEGTMPKAGDAAKIWNWINGENDDKGSYSISDSETPYISKNITSLIEIIKDQQKLLAEQSERMKSQEETIRTYIIAKHKDIPMRKKIS